jgi:hypothetical protein
MYYKLEENQKTSSNYTDYNYNLKRSPLFQNYFDSYFQIKEEIAKENEGWSEQKLKKAMT